MIGDKIKQFRIDNNMKQSTIANHLKMSQSAYSKIENNKNEPNISAIKTLAILFNTTCDELLEYENRKKKSQLETLFNKLNSDNKLEVIEYIQFRLDKQDRGKLSNSQNKKSNAG